MSITDVDIDIADYQKSQKKCSQSESKPSNPETLKPQAYTANLQA